MDLQTESRQYLASLLQTENSITKKKLEAYIDHLLANNVYRLRWILYRIDVDEEHLRKEIETSAQPKAAVVTRLLMERCKEIIKTRRQFNNQSVSFENNE